MRISNSEIQAFKRCKRKWWLTYYRGLKFKRESDTGARQVGTRVHAAVAQYYDLKAKGMSDELAHDSAMTLLDRLIDEATERSQDDKATVSELDLTRAVVEGYFEWLEESGADEDLEIVAAEEVVDIERTVPDIEVPVTLGAKLDLRVRSKRDGSMRFMDHKVVQDFTMPTRTLSLDEQMLMYEWLLQQRYPDTRIDGAIYNMLRKSKRTARAKPPFYERFEVRHSQQEIESFRIRLIGELQDILETRRLLDEGADHRLVVYPTPTRNCSWDCDFFAVCNLIDRPQDKPENLLRSLYVVGDPYERYDETKGNVE
jgi:hypothetical protein